MDQGDAIKVLAAMLVAALTLVSALLVQRAQHAADKRSESRREDGIDATVLVTVTKIYSELQELRDDVGVNHGEVVGAIKDHQRFVDDRLQLYVDGLNQLRRIMEPPAA